MIVILIFVLAVLIWLGIGGFIRLLMIFEQLRYEHTLKKLALKGNQKAANELKSLHGKSISERINITVGEKK